MDPHNPASFNHRLAKLATGRTYHFVDQVPKDYDHQRTTTLLCVHGFPDLWYGWRYQIGPWVHKGYRVVVPDMLGYGGTDKPHNSSEYSTQKLCADLAALLDILGVQQAVLIGHDWGAFTVGRFALWYPERLLSLVMLSVPYTPPSQVYIPIEEIAKRVPNLGYQVYFANSASTSEIESNLRNFLSLIFKPPEDTNDITGRGALYNLLVRAEEQKNSVLDDKEFEHYLKEFSNSGMNGPLNYYRTGKHRHEEEERAKLQTNLPRTLRVLFMWGTQDPTTIPLVINKSKKFIDKLQDVAFEGKGHWLMVEAKDEVTNKVLAWLQEMTFQPIVEGKL
ncbi:hypothetical protein C0991_007866 [Blastosporella zonata]|nr:hypothetical protein C0991_007866 [Blastosporella zonata]